jgi:hypothetical protein
MKNINLIQKNNINLIKKGNKLNFNDIMPLLALKKRLSHFPKKKPLFLYIKK